MRHRLIVGILVAAGLVGGPVAAQSPSAAPAAASPAAAAADLDATLGATATGMSLVDSDPVAALAACRDAWASVQGAMAAGVDAATSDPVEQLVRTCLDRLHRVRLLGASTLKPMSGFQPAELADDRDGHAFFIDSTTGAVWRSDLDRGQSARIVAPGDGPGRGIAPARMLSAAGRSLVILDAKGRFWRWRDGAGLTRMPAPRIPDGVGGATILATMPIDAGRDLANAYLLDPVAAQIWGFEPAIGERGFVQASRYLAADNEDLSKATDLLVDGSLFVLDPDGLRRYDAGRRQTYALAVPPDDADLRPGHDYRHVALDGSRFLVYDAAWDRIIAFDRETGDYLEQWRSDDASAPLADAIGLAVAGAGGPDPRVVVASPAGISSAPLP